MSEEVSAGEEFSFCAGQLYGKNVIIILINNISNKLAKDPGTLSLACIKVTTEFKTILASKQKKLQK